MYGHFFFRRYIIYERGLKYERVSVAHRCWPFTWRPITMAIPWWCHRACQVVCQVPCPALKRVMCPPLPPRVYWCTTTRNRPTRTVWVSLRIRRRRRRPSSPRKNTTSRGDRTTTTTGCLITPGLAGGWRVSASRVTCTSSMTIPMAANCFRFV